MKLPEDPLILELLPEFADDWLNDTSTKYPEIIGTKNKEDLYRFGHTLKGSSLQFGFEDAAKYGYEIMDISKAEDWSKAEQMQTILLQVFQEIKELAESGLSA